MQGKLGGWAEAVLRCKLSELYRCTTSVQFEGIQLGHGNYGGPSLSEILVGARHPRGRYQHQGMVQCADVDGVGELFAAGDDVGILSVCYVQTLMDAKKDANTLNTALTLQTPIKNKVCAVRWNPGNQDELGVVHQGAKALYLYDINRTQGSPARSILFPQSVKGGGDFMYLGGDGHKYGLAVGTMNGRVLLWDTRISGPPVCTLRSMSSDAISSLDVLENGYIVVGGTVAGDVKGWDVRMTSGRALSFSAVPNQHPVLFSTKLSSEFMKVDGLLDQCGYIPPCAVQDVKKDPETQSRLALHLSSGWTCVFDLCCFALTHLHAPPTSDHVDSSSQQEESSMGLMSRPMDDYSSIVTWWDTTEGGGAVSVEGGGRWLRRRRGTWIDGSRFAVPSRRRNAVHVIDFDNHHYSGTSIFNTEEDSERPRAAVEIDMPHESTCVFSCKHSESMFALGEGSRCCILSHDNDTK